MKWKDTFSYGKIFQLLYLYGLSPVVTDIISLLSAYITTIGEVKLSDFFLHLFAWSKRAIFPNEKPSSLLQLLDTEYITQESQIDRWTKNDDWCKLVIIYSHCFSFTCYAISSLFRRRISWIVAVWLTFFLLLIQWVVHTLWSEEVHYVIRLD